ncbi:hypothetical protein D3C78_1931270 [compost metagenome]
MRASERHYVGEQPVLVVQLPVLSSSDGGIAVPAEGFQRLFDEFGSVLLIQAALLFALFDQLQNARREDLPLVQDRLG